MKDRRPLTFIGIDPSARAGGYCLEVDGDVVVGHCPIHEVGALPWDEWDAATVVAAIECPKRMYRGSNHVVRSAANQWLAVLRQRYPRRVKLIASYGDKFVDPAAWRSAILRSVPGDDWKARAVRYASFALGADTITDHNEAEAYCLMQFARVAYRLRKP